MKARILDRLALRMAWIIAAVLVLLPFHAFFTTWIGSNTGHLDLVRIWKELIIVCLVPPTVLLLSKKPLLSRSMIRSWLFRLLVAYVLLFAVIGVWAEQVVAALHHMFPDAPIYTSYCSDKWREKLDNKVVTGYLQHWPFSRLRKFLPVLRQHWFKSLDLSNFDLVISSSGNGEAKFVHVPQTTTHVCYCHTPPHFYWSKYNEYLAHPGFRPQWLARLGLKLLVKPLRKRDYQAAQGVDYFIANSSHVQADIKQYYNRDSVIIHPPVDTEQYASVTHGSDADGFIMWGRHVPYKRFDLAIEACNQLSLPLTIVGQGPETKRLQAMAGPTVNFTGYVSREELLTLASKAAAFIFPAEEDFGIAPVEAMAAGLPVIAYKSGGALDYVTPGKTGEFFDEQTVDSLVLCLKSFDTKKYPSNDIKRSAETFSNKIFGAAILKQLEHILQ